MGNCLVAAKPNQYIRSPESEKKEITEAYKDVIMKEGQVWNVVSAKWWNHWKIYSGYREENDELQTRKFSPSSVNSFDEEDDGPKAPGRINNSDIVAPNGELKREINEHEDFVILPGEIYVILEQWYGSVGPKFIRHLIREEEGYNVDLYPVRFECVLANDNGQEPPRSSKNNRKIFHFHPRDMLGKVEDTIIHGYDLSNNHCRLWLKIGEESEEETSQEDKDAGNDGWTLLEHSHRRRQVEWITEDALGMDGAPIPVRCLLEYKKQNDIEYPRDCIHNKPVDNEWRDKLERGSIVDALDSDHRWFDSEVLDVRIGPKGESEVLIHYRGWTHKWDKWVDRQSSTIQRLFTHTVDWRNNLGCGDQLEVCDKVFSGQKKHLWHIATIGKVKMEVGEGERRMAELHTDAYEDAAWGDMFSENLCCMYTHTKKSQHRSSASSSNPSSPTPSSTLSSPTASKSPWAKGSVQGQPIASGTVGLSNLGNTCFMNSMIQCLVQAKPLTKYFLSGKHKADLNRKNFLGTGGKLVEAYAELVKKIFSGSYSTVVPRDFKAVLGKFAPQFAGVQQQDSQEFMSFLLDGIHEDLNRVINKQATEVVEGGDGKPDDEVASEAWRRHLLRNDSVIVDNCQGLLKSHLKCPTCGHESVTFDPYMSLSLPLPSARSGKGSLRKLIIVIVPLEGTPEVVQIRIPSGGTIADLRAAVAELRPNLASERLRICDVWSNRVYKVYKSAERLVEIRVNDETYVYEVSHSPQATPAAGSRSRAKSFSADKDQRMVRFVDILMAQNNKENDYDDDEGGDGARGSRSGGGGAKISARSQRDDALSVSLFSSPFHLSFDNKTTCKDIRDKISKFALKCYKKDLKQSDDDYTLIVGNGEGAELGVVLGHGSGGDAQLFGDWLDDLNIPKGNHGKALVMIWKSKTISNKLSFEAKNGWHSPKVKSKAGGPGDLGAEDVIKLESCFSNFVAEEQLGESDLWYCSKCKDHVPAKKKFDLWTCPDVLILHLKRFEYIPGQYFMHRQKITTLVDFPLEGLDLSNFVKGPINGESPPVYDLFGVSEHIGVLGGGHYTAVVKNNQSDGWYGFDDTKVSIASPQDACTPHAYVLFYERRGPPSRWAGMKLPPNAENGSKNIKTPKSRKK